MCRGRLCPCSLPTTHQEATQAATRWMGEEAVAHARQDGRKSCCFQSHGRTWRMLCPEKRTRPRKTSTAFRT